MCAKIKTKFKKSNTIDLVLFSSDEWSESTGVLVDD
jgi:hypothetical protein